MDRRLFTIGAASVLTAGAAPMPAPAPAPTTTAGTAAPSAVAKTAPTPPPPSKLRAGQFKWQPDLSPAGALVFIVSLPEQLIHVYRNGVRIGVSTCSTGKPGHLTPTGVFVILQKDKDHHSSIYDDAPMPNMQRLTWSGVALHAGNLPGYPASHGCVRLPKQFSEIIFNVTHLGIPVIIADMKTQPQVVVHPGLVLPAEAQAQALKAMTEAARAKDPKNVMSGVVSSADKRAIIMVDGVVTWDSPITIDEPGKPLGEESFTLLGPSNEKGTYRWMAHSLKREVIGRHDHTLSRIHVKKIEDQKRMLAEATGNPTLVVTDTKAGIDTRTRPNFVVIDAIS